MKTYLEPEEVRLLEEAATCLRDRLLIRLLFHIGCRISEALAIKVEDIDFEHHTITILHLKSHIRLSCRNCGARLGQRHRFCPACGDEVGSTLSEDRPQQRMRVLPIDPSTLQMLRDYIKRGGLVLRNGQRFIFGINRHRGWQVVRDYAERAGLPRLFNPETGRMRGISPHRLRDAFAVHRRKDQ